MFFKIKMPLLGAVLVTTAISAAHAQNFNVPGDDLSSALAAFTTQSGVTLVASSAEMRGLKTNGVKGNFSPEEALTKILRGTGFVYTRDDAGVLEIVRQKSSALEIAPLQLAQANPPQRAAVETVTVTSSKLGGADVQSIPISITALSQEQLTATQTAGGPDLVKQVPNLTFTKTNFTGYSIQIRGIGTQAISVTTDPAVAVALNDIPFIRNHFFEQEFYDLGQAEVLRGPQGTLYGRNATAGVVNLITAKPSDQFEAMASGEIGSYHQRRFEGMINLPIVDDRLDIRLAGEWTKRQGYSFNALDNQRVDGRDLWSGRMTIGWKPTENLQTYLLWEHFSENDDRMRTAKQLCKTDHAPDEVGGVAVTNAPIQAYDSRNFLSQGCVPTSLYSNEAFETPDGTSLPYYEPIGNIGAPITANNFRFDPYASTTQSHNLRVIETTLDPIYKAKNDVVEFNADYHATSALIVTSQTGFSQDFLWSTEDYNRFNTRPGAFEASYSPSSGAPPGLVSPDPGGLGVCKSALGSCLAPGEPCSNPGLDPSTDNCLAYGVFCDPQLGCSNRLVAQDLSEEHAWQLSQEFRLASNFAGPLNFSVGGNYLHYETEENYYVFINTLTLASYAWSHDHLFIDQPLPWVPGVSDNANCLVGGLVTANPRAPSVLGVEGEAACMYIDPNPLTSLNNQGHNYFLSQNPYSLNSYAAFGEAYYNVTPELKLTAGVRWTEDQKHFVDIPSELLVFGYGYPIVGAINQQWDQFTGRAAVNWSPKLTFTDQTLIYGSYAHGYKAGGANPPGAALLGFGGQNTVTNPIHPLTFKPEFIDAFELGSKNTLLDGALTLNVSAFYYNYQNYQISEIVDRTAINLNFGAHVKGAELESTWEPLPGLRFNFAGGWEDTAMAQGSKAVDLMDRTAGNSNWILVKPFVTQASNCVLPVYVVAADMVQNFAQLNAACTDAYAGHVDPLTRVTYVANPTIPAETGPIPAGYPGFDPLAGTPGDPYTGQNIYNGVDYGAAPNNGEGFDKDLSGNELPNAPPFTVSVGAQFTLPLTSNWAGTLRADYYWQDYSWARIFNDKPYDRLRGYTNVNLTLILTSQSGWQVMLYDKNIFNTTDITGAFLNSDDSGLTTNVFLTDPRLVGVRVTKNW